MFLLGVELIANNSRCSGVFAGLPSAIHLTRLVRSGIAEPTTRSISTNEVVVPRTLRGRKVDGEKN